MTFWVTCTYKGHTIHGATYYHDKVKAMAEYLRCVFRGDTDVHLFVSDYLHPENSCEIWTNAKPVPVNNDLPF